MSAARAVRLLVLALSLPAFVPSAHAAWPHDPTDNVPVTTSALSQSLPVAVSDGAGGMIIAWQDTRNGVADIYAQRMSATGSKLWLTSGVVICNAIGAQTTPRIAADGAGGAVIVWKDERFGAATSDVYAQRIDGSGAVRWGALGVLVCNATGAQIDPQIVSDGVGGAIIAWEDQRGGTASDIYVRRVLSNGVATWTGNGNLVCNATGTQTAQQLTPDGAGGAILVWADGRVIGTDIYVQRVNASGTMLWTANGIAVCTQLTTQGLPVITTDGVGGAILCWYDNRVTSNENLYAARVTSAGALPWTSQGVLVCNAAASQVFQLIVPTTGGGAILAWRDSRGGTLDVYAQRLSSTGAVQWGAGGAQVHAILSGSQLNVQLVSDGGLGAYLVWEDANDLFAQHLNSIGARMWANDYTPVTTAANYQSSAAIVLGTNGVLIAWDDQRADGATSDIYAQRMEQDGLIGDPEPLILSVRDVPNDQGGLVRVRWQASYRDLEPWSEIEWYFVDHLIGPTSYETIAIVPAAGLAEYAAMIPTITDSTAGSPSYYRLRISTGPRLGIPWPSWESAPDSGCSVDNLTPVPPGAFAGRIDDGRVWLSWSAGLEPDLAGYRVYRGGPPGAAPTAGQLVAEPLAPSFDEPAGADGLYRVTAFDRHGNESAASAIVLQTAGTAPAAGTRFYLAGVSPNPSRAVAGALIRFGLPQRGDASLAIYDPAGRRVRVLASGAREAGEHVERWDGRDERGETAHAGLYFIHLVSPGRAATQRLVLVP